MTRKLKALGLALFAVFAMSAVVASVAQAGEFEVVGGGTVTITGEQVSGEVTAVVVPKHEFKTDAGVFKCTTVKSHGSITGSPTSMRLSATYGNTTAGTECTVAGLAGLVVHMNGCEHEFTGGKTIGVTSNINETMHIVCPPGKVIETTLNATCTVTVGPQTFPESMVAAINNATGGTGMDFTRFIDLSGIDYTEHGTCPNGGGNTITKTNGTYKGVTTIKAEVGTTPVGLTVK